MATISGTSIDSLQQAITKNFVAGQTVPLSFQLDHPVSMAEVQQIEAALRQNGVKLMAPISLQGSSTIGIQFSMPSTEGIGFFPVIPVIIGAVTLVAGIAAWKFASEASKSKNLPIVLGIGGGVLLLGLVIWLQSKKPATA